MTRRSIAPGRPDLMGETVAEAAEEEPAPGAAVVCPYRETVTAMNPAPRTEIVAQVSAGTVPLSATAGGGGGGGGLCQGQCGSSSLSGDCYCDESCASLGDCCPGVCVDCPTLSHCGGGGPLCGFGEVENWQGPVPGNSTLEMESVTSH